MSYLQELHDARRQRLARLDPRVESKKLLKLRRPKPPVVAETAPASDLSKPPVERPILPIPIGGRPTAEATIKAVCQYCSVTKADLTGARVYQSLVWPRQLATAIMREQEKSLPEIGRALGGRDHTTIMHADRQAHLKFATEPLKACAFETVKNSLRTAGYYLVGDILQMDFELTHPAYIGA